MARYIIRRGSDNAWLADSGGQPFWTDIKEAAIEFRLHFTVLAVIAFLTQNPDQLSDADKSVVEEVPFND